MCSLEKIFFCKEKKKKKSEPGKNALCQKFKSEKKETNSIESTMPTYPMNHV
jgi:hypothetical protein